MDFNNLTDLHERIKNHPFRMNRTDWKGYWLLLKDFEKEFSNLLSEKFDKNYDNDYWLFLHEFSSAIFHFQFEFNENTDYKLGERGRLGCSSEGSDEKEGRIYGKIVPEYQRKIIIILESYIQQVHRFITSNGDFPEFITYYLGLSNIYDDKSNGGRWNKYKFNQEKQTYEFAGKLR